MGKKGTLPSKKLILGHKDLLGNPFIKACRISLLKGVSRLDGIAGLNFRLKGREKQKKSIIVRQPNCELMTFSGRNKSLYNKYAKLIDQKAQGRHVYLLSRQACFFALEEVTQI